IVITTGVGGDKRPWLTFEDDGVGLTEADIHRFLATIGESSKRGPGAREDFLGQFGIGLLSCFVVADEIVAAARPARWLDEKTRVFRGRADGTHDVAASPTSRAPGTTVLLRAKPGSEKLFAPNEIERLALHFGALLPYPISIRRDGSQSLKRIN